MLFLSYVVSITKNRMIFYILLLLCLFIKNVSSFKEFFIKKRKQELYTNGMLLKFRDLVLFFFFFFEAYLSKRRAQGLWVMQLERTEY